MEEAIDVGGDADGRLQSAVAAGISEARQRVLSKPDKGRGQDGTAAGTSAGDSSVEQSAEHASSSPESGHVGDPSASSDGVQASKNPELSERELMADITDRNSNTS